MNIQINNVKKSNIEFHGQILESINEVILSGEYIDGKNVKKFENSFSSFCGAKHGISVNCGTDALIFSLEVLNLPKGSCILVTSLTFPATIMAIYAVGMIPVFVDIDETLNISVLDMKKKLNANVKAVILVHWAGLLCNVEEILSICKENNLYVIEDAAQAHGASYKNQNAGSFGHLGCFSFHATKTISSIGNGGMVVTNDNEFAESIRLLRNFGRIDREEFIKWGRNSVLDEVQAAVLNIKFENLEKINNDRISIANNYNESLADLVKIPVVPQYYKHVYHLYSIRIERNRDKIMTYLNENNIGAVPHYSIPCHQQKFLKKSIIKNLNNTNLYSEQLLSLPVTVSLEEQEYVVTKLKKALKKYN